jgi:hypothetical protein
MILRHIFVVCIDHCLFAVVNWDKRERGRERERERKSSKGVGQQVFFCLYICVSYTVTSWWCSSKQSFVVVFCLSCRFVRWLLVLLVRQIFFSTNHVRQSSTSRFFSVSPFNFCFIGKKEEKRQLIHYFVLRFFPLSLSL